MTQPDECWICKVDFDALPHEERMRYFKMIRSGGQDLEQMRAQVNADFAAEHATHGRSWIG